MCRQDDNGPIVWSRNCICWSFFCPPRNFVRSERLCNAQQKRYGILRRQIIGRVGGRKNKTRWIRQQGNNWWVTQCIYKVHSMPQQDLKPDFIGQSKCCVCVCVCGLTKIGFRILSCWDMRDWLRRRLFFSKDERRKTHLFVSAVPHRMDANSQEMQFFFSLFPKRNRDGGDFIRDRRTWIRQILASFSLQLWCQVPCRWRQCMTSVSVPKKMLFKNNFFDYFRLSPKKDTSCSCFSIVRKNTPGDARQGKKKTLA